MKGQGYWIFILLIFGVLHSACSFKNIVGTYTNKLGETQYYETLSLAADGQFSYCSNCYSAPHVVPYMPMLSSAPNSIGTGSYTLNGKNLVLSFTGDSTQLPVVTELDTVVDYDKYHLEFLIIDREMANEGLPFATAAVVDFNTKQVLGGENMDLDGTGSMLLKAQDFPCHLRFAYLGLVTQEVVLEKAGNFRIEVVMDGQPVELHGQKIYPIIRKKGKLNIGEMKK